MAQTYQFDFFTDYGQFYICDRDSPLATDSENFWTTEALDSLMAIEEGVIGIGGEGNKVKGEIKLLDSPGVILNTDSYDYVVEGSLQIRLIFSLGIEFKPFSRRSRV